MNTTKIFIEIKGGYINAITTNTANVQIDVLDYDKEEPSIETLVSDKVLTTDELHAFIDDKDANKHKVLSR